MNDDTLMSFGKYRGQKLKDVSASYLLWMGDNITPTDTFRTELLKYIATNRQALEAEVDEQRRTEND